MRLLYLIQIIYLIIIKIMFIEIETVQGNYQSWEEFLLDIQRKQMKIEEDLTEVYKSIKKLDGLKSNIVETTDFITGINKYLTQETYMPNNIKSLNSYHKSKENVWRYEEEILENEKNMKQLQLELKENKYEIAEFKKKTKLLKEELKISYGKLLNEMKERSERFNENVNKSMIKITNKYKFILEEHNDFLNHLDHEEGIKLLKYKIEICADLITNQSYDKAVQIFNSINNTNELNTLVGLLFKLDRTANSLDLLLNFSDKIENEKQKVLLYQAIDTEMGVLNDNDVFKVLKLMKAIRNTIKEDKKFSKEYEVDNLINVIKNRLKLIAVDYLKNNFLHNNNYNNKTLTDDVTEQLYNLDMQLFEEVYKRFIKDVYKYKHISVKELLTFTRNLYYIEQKILGFLDVFNEMKINNNLNNKETINLAYYIKEIENMEKYNLIRDYFKVKLNELKDNLPKCIKNLVFLKKHYIRNVGSNEYMYAYSMNNNIINENTRYALANDSSTQNCTGGVEWKLNRISNDDNKYYIFNVKYNEYLSADVHSTLDKENRYVLTSNIDAKNVEPHCYIWYIELINDNCLIKNYLYREYMFRSKSKSFSLNSHHIYTYKVNDTIKSNPLSQWLFVYEES